jgi:hypothetical protein
MGHTPHPLGWPSVTQVLAVIDKPFLFYWAAKNGLEFCERVKRESGELGQAVHELIAYWLEHKQLPDNVLADQALELFNEWKVWQLENDFRPLEIERKVEHKELHYHGTFDAIGTFGDSPDVYAADWKTSSKIDDMYGAQLAAYAAAFTEETGVNVTGGIIVRMDKKGGPLEAKRFDNLDKYMEVFKACLFIYNFLHPVKVSKRRKAA